MAEEGKRGMRGGLSSGGSKDGSGEGLYSQVQTRALARATRKRTAMNLMFPCARVGVPYHRVLGVPGIQHVSIVSLGLFQG